MRSRTIGVAIESVPTVRKKDVPVSETSIRATVIEASRMPKIKRLANPMGIHRPQFLRKGMATNKRMKGTTAVNNTIGAIRAPVSTRAYT